MQLDLDDFVQALSRVAVRLVGINSIRHLVSASLLLLCLLVAGVWLLRNLRTGRRSRPLVCAIAALGVPTTWFALSMISHHDLGMVLSDDVWDALIVGSLIALACSAWVASPSRKAGHAA